MVFFPGQGDSGSVVLFRVTPLFFVCWELLMLFMIYLGSSYLDLFGMTPEETWLASPTVRAFMWFAAIWAGVMFVWTLSWFARTKGAIVIGTATELRHTKAMRLGGLGGYYVERITNNLSTVEIQRPPAIDMPGESSVRYDFVSTTETLRVDTVRFAVPDDFHDRFRRWQQLVATNAEFD